MESDVTRRPFKGASLLCRRSGVFMKVFCPLSWNCTLAISLSTFRVCGWFFQLIGFRSVADLTEVLLAASEAGSVCRVVSGSDWAGGARNSLRGPRSAWQPASAGRLRQCGRSRADRWNGNASPRGATYTRHELDLRRVFQDLNFVPEDELENLQ